MRESLLFWEFTRPRLVVNNRRFRTTHRSRLQESSNPRSPLHKTPEERRSKPWLLMLAQVLRTVTDSCTRRITTLHTDINALCNEVYNFFFVTKCSYLKTNSVEEVPSWEANSSSALKEIFRILWNPMVPYRVHKSPPDDSSPPSPILF